MGSSSKSKGKERKKRSRSKEKEPKSSSRHESRKRHRHKEEADDSDGVDSPSPTKVSRRDAKKEPDAELVLPSSSGGQVQEELSIEETNKVRIALGLKPLELGSTSKGGGDGTSKTDASGAMVTDEVFIKTENLSDKREAEKIRERVQTQKEKRKHLERLKSIKPLGHAEDDEDDSAASFVLKSKALERIKAEKKSKELAELDEDFETDAKERKMIKKQNLYKGRDLSGLTVGHNLDRIKEGSQVILTLKDAYLLDEDNADANNDVLENVNIIDEERAAENVANKKLGKRDYNPYDDGLEGTLLSKYDETIDGRKKDSFKLGGVSTFEEVSLRLKRAQEEAKLEGKILVSLDADTPGNSASGPSKLSTRFASEYFTEEEMKSFKKPKRRVKKGSLRKRTDDELPLIAAGSSASDPDLGSRSKRRKTDAEVTFTDGDADESIKSEAKPETIDFPTSSKSLKARLSLLDIDEDIDFDPTDDLASIVVEDDGAEEELQSALEKARKLKSRKAPPSVNEIATRIKVEREAEMDAEIQGTSGSLNMNSVAEFCRNIGDIPTVTGLDENDADMNDSDEDDAVIKPTLKEKEYKKPLIRSADPSIKSDLSVPGDPSSSASKSMSKSEIRSKDKRELKKGQWSEVKDMDVDSDSSSDDGDAPSSARNSKATPILGEEPDLTVGVAAALRLAMNKGYLEKDSGKRSAAPKVTSISAVNYLIDEKFSEDRRGGGGPGGHRDRYSGPVSDFQEKPNYRPDVNLEYIDDEGRMLNEKEAFRILSHKFHGKGPGKNKIDKREKKLKQESKLRQMSSIDTPLNTVRKLQEKQKELQSPYVVISRTETSQIRK